jgi:hypothetical protein
MNEHAWRTALLMASPFLGAAIALTVKLLKRRTNQLACGGLFAANLQGLRIEDPQLRARVVFALEQRRRLESIPLGVKIAGSIWIIAGLSLVGAAAADLIPHTQEPVWYAITCLGLALLMVRIYFQIRTPQPVRVAVLQPRASTQVIPPYWYALVLLSSCAVLTYVRFSQLTAAAIIVCAASLALAAIAWRLTQLPARLLGQDVEIERFVDDGVRFRRAAAVLFLAIGQSYIFMSLTLKYAGDLQQGAFAATALLFIGNLCWMIVQFRRRPDVSGARAA